MILFDSHAHYYDNKFGDVENQKAIIEKIRSAGVKYVLNAGTNPVTSRLCIKLADENEGFFASVGVHPEDIDEYTDIDSVLEDIKSLAQHEKVVAIGEIGLDYHWRTDNSKIQMDWFVKQLQMAKDLDLPVIVHDREAHGDCLAAIRNFPDVKGVFHSFSGSRETAQELIKYGWYISFSGVITFKNATKLAEVVPSIPDDRILIETDCPYLAPHPFRSQINDSSLMLYTAQKAAELRSVSLETICKQTAENAERIFSKAKISL